MFSLKSIFSYFNNKDVHVLLIGNSYTHSNQMPKILSKMASSKGRHVNIEVNAPSGHSFKMHAEREELFDHINSRKWDLVLLQGFSAELSHPINYIEKETTPYFEKIVNSIRVNNKETKLLLFQTWGYKDGVKSKSEINSFFKMTDVIENGYNHLGTKFNIEVVNVGRVWEKFIVKNPLPLYAADGQHPSLLGSYFIACVLLTRLFYLSALGSYHPRTITKKEARLIQGFVSKTT